MENLKTMKIMNLASNWPVSEAMGLGEIRTGQPFNRGAKCRWDRSK